MKIHGVDIRPGMLLEYNGKLWKALKTQHTQPGKGGAFMQVEMKCVTDGTKLNERFRSSDTVEKASLEVKKMQYLYPEGENLTFMDTTSYEQVSMDKEMLGDQLPWLQENMNVDVEFYGEQAIGVALPAKITMEVVEADAVVKGQTASSSYKPAKVAGGVTVLVPPYITVGESIVINTVDGTFAGRAQ
ncbi:MAG TPA: elongation factor P [Alphaproteobacteria bacterium]|nr:elongation factor P [Alphaproteobacteria bacterium]